MADRTASSLADDFFSAPFRAATNHEEWLLRRYSELMAREAQVTVRMQQQQQHVPYPSRPRGRAREKGAAADSADGTPASGPRVPA